MNAGKFLAKFIIETGLKGLLRFALQRGIVRYANVSKYTPSFWLHGALSKVHVLLDFLTVQCRILELT